MLAPTILKRIEENMKARDGRGSNGGANVKITDLYDFDPITANQEIAFASWDEGDNLVLSGSAGTGKTFIACYLGLEAVLEKEYQRLVIVRSVVPVREMGFLPGSADEKKDVFSAPYKAIFSELVGDVAAYNKLINSRLVEFESTSFIRGITYDNSIIIVDEMQNMNFHELDSIITRVGNNCRIIFSGDYRQTDFKYKDEKDGILQFLNIVERLNNFSVINFGWDDIVRSDFVRDYIMTKEMLGY